MAEYGEKVYENRLRRIAERRGWKLAKSRRRDPLARDFGLYRVVADDGHTVLGRGARVLFDEPTYRMTLEEVEEALAFIECQVLRCGREAKHGVGSTARGRRTEAAVCSEHKTQIEEGTESTDWALIRDECAGYVIYLGADLAMLGD